MYENVLLQILVQAAIQPTPTARLYGYADITRASRILPCSMQIRAFLAAEGQRGVHTADTVSGAGVDDMTRAVAQHQERQAVRVCVGASRRALGGIIGQQTSASGRAASTARSFSF